MTEREQMEAVLKYLGNERTWERLTGAIESIRWNQDGTYLNKWPDWAERAWAQAWASVPEEHPLSFAGRQGLRFRKFIELLEQKLKELPQ
jgi:hypothetical protein